MSKLQIHEPKVMQLVPASVLQEVYEKNKAYLPSMPTSSSRVTHNNSPRSRISTERLDEDNNGGNTTSRSIVSPQKQLLQA